MGQIIFKMGRLGRVSVILCFDNGIVAKVDFQTLRGFCDFLLAGLGWVDQRFGNDLPKSVLDFVESSPAIDNVGKK